MKVAIVHYWLTGLAGGERVLESLCRLYPQARIYTHVLDRDVLSPQLQERDIATTFINRLPFSRRMYQRYLPLMPLALEQLDLREYDLVISSESGPAKGVITRADTAHVCYCHSPMRYLWDFYQEYLESAGRLTRLIMRPAFHRLRVWDAVSSMRVDAFAANSRTVARRIAKHWRREARVIHPPVALNAEALVTPPGAPKPPDEPFYLYTGRLAPYKRADIAVEACAKAGLPLVIIGDGPELRRLQALAGPKTHFLGRQPDSVLTAHYAACKALLFPAEEDFGLVPVEAQACGAPVIAYGRGGALETVLPDVSGIFFAEQNADSLLAALERAQATRFDPAAIRAHAQTFSEARFHREFEQLAQETLAAVRA